ncbi:MAG: type II toxin-antitoxin system MqsR family toxin [Deltaproteobacteria bacterium]|nr:type II toxin-antitoxin system MqsR family toxin [Deltaproteobacteria bacterium]MBW2595708.1 type II toxin-antitoxin system MqsR family toxin [Deltaproteobacteria bacterium]
MKKRREELGKATYDLDELKKFIDKGNFYITRNCRREYSKLGYSEDTVLEIIGKLPPTDIYKTMPAKKMPDLMQDVYHIKEEKDDLYIKLQKSSCGEKCIIIQFKLE